MNTGDFAALLNRHERPVGALTSKLVATIQALRPDLEGTVRLGWGSVNFRHKRAGLICAVFPLAGEVRLVFEHGRLLSNDSGLLQGAQRQIRSIHLKPGAAIPEAELGLLLAEAIALRS
ncbi:MAG: hypothetical protein ABL866_01275 [Devosia sp.]